MQKGELAIIYQNKHINFGHTEAGLRESRAMLMISGMLHVKQKLMNIVRKMSCEAQAGKCTLETLTTDMFSEVTITNHKCHVSGIKEQIWQALLCPHVIVKSIKIYK